MSTPIAVEGIGFSSSARASLRELGALARLALFLRVDGADITGRDATIALLAFVTLAVWIIADPLLHSRDLVFSWFAIPDLAWIAAGVLAVTWVLNRLARPLPGFRRVLLLTLGALPLAMLGEIASWKLVESTLRLVVAALSLFALVYFARGLKVLTGRHQPLALLAGLLVAGAFIASLDYLQANPRLWVRAEERMDRGNAAGVDWVRMSRAQFEQQARIDAQIAKLAPQREGATDVYFVGFAGYGQEQIFAREIDLAAQVVGERYGSEGRTLRLVNDRGDLDSWPIASAPGLRYALRRLGEVMGDEDVLFLAFASHGDRDAGVRVSSPGMITTRISPGQLDEMLREAGIGYRVIVVSACYSGSFVDTLSNDRSAVITAAAQDRKSFGCNDSRFLTYFGEAFFRDALGGAGSLRQAFQTASAALDRKERASGIVPSMPQASFGAQIEARLDGAARAANHR